MAAASRIDIRKSKKTKSKKANSSREGSNEAASPFGPDAALGNRKGREVRGISFELLQGS
jgi:hypothetical protein